VLYPALSVTGADGELVLAVADDHSPTAAEQSGDSITIFFRDAGARDAARQAIAAAFPRAAIAPREVDDEDWARRSQENLQPITVGRLTVYPFLRDLRLLRRSPEPRAPSPEIVIQPSMGFGTGHHATTRLCLLALQREELAGRSVLDIGAGSGILAIAAARLGAARAVGIDHDPDAIHAARGNLALNPEATGVAFEVAELADLTAGTTTATVRLKADTTGTTDVVSGFSRTWVTADIVVANLTGALLTREARRMLVAVRSGGRLIVSGLLAAERDHVMAAFHPAEILWESREDEWVVLTFGAPNVLR
jgi:ribosomal protein L11 methyltransferase